MYGIIMVAILTGIIGIQIMKRRSIKDIKGIAIEIKIKIKVQALSNWRSFGLGWALVGACPGPIFILLGAGFFECFDCFWDVFIWSLKDKLPINCYNLKKVNSIF
jgi:hypothetical protein